MADEKPKNQVDTTEYKTARISIPKARATLSRLKNVSLKALYFIEFLTRLVRRMSLAAYHFWARFWAQKISSFTCESAHPEDMIELTWRDVPLIIVLTIFVGAALFWLHDAIDLRNFR